MDLSQVIQFVDNCSQDDLSIIEMVVKRSRNKFHCTADERKPKKIPNQFNPESIQLPFNGKFSETWCEWCKFRSSKKKPLSEMAAKKQIELLQCYPETVAIQMLIQSITNDWQGIFEVKNATFTNGQQQSTSNNQSGINGVSDRFTKAAQRIAERHAGK